MTLSRRLCCLGALALASVPAPSLAQEEHAAAGCPYDKLWIGGSCPRVHSRSLVRANGCCIGGGREGCAAPALTPRPGVDSSVLALTGDAPRTAGTTTTLTGAARAVRRATLRVRSSNRPVAIVRCSLTGRPTRSEPAACASGGSKTPAPAPAEPPPPPPTCECGASRVNMRPTTCLSLGACTRDEASARSGSYTCMACLDCCVGDDRAEVNRLSETPLLFLS